MERQRGHFHPGSCQRIDHSFVINGVARILQPVLHRSHGWSQSSGQQVLYIRDRLLRGLAMDLDLQSLGHSEIEQNTLSLIGQINSGTSR